MFKPLSPGEIQKIRETVLPNMEKDVCSQLDNKLPEIIKDFTYNTKCVFTLQIPPIWNLEKVDSVVEDWFEKAGMDIILTRTDVENVRVRKVVYTGKEF